MSKEINLLIQQCQKQNRKAQMSLYDLYCEAMYKVACRYLPDEDAKDAMQEGFLKAFTNILSFTETASFGAWLKRIIINQCIDELKRKKLQTVSAENHQLEIVDDTDWFFNQTITKEQIVNAVDKLSDKYKLVVKLYLLEGYDHSEISEILGINVKTSRTQLRRGKLQLQELLKTLKNEAGY